MRLLVRELACFFAAVRFFTRLPVPAWVGHSAELLDAAPRYFPAVGLVVGGIGAAVFWLAALVWPQPVAVLLSMAATLYATGAFHEDGLSDMADGFGGGWTRERILEIMKDSRVGSYGVTALILALAGKATLLSLLPAAWVPAALVAGHAVSRFCSGALMALLDYVRGDGAAGGNGASKARPVAARMSPAALAVAGLFAAVGLGLWCLLAPPLPLLPALALALFATAWLVRLMRRNLGGYTGDCLGAVQQVSELAFYLGLLARWPAV